jgi:8-oxo-dGTP pyrophosphatase MutT (NUDIX family)
MPATHRNVAGGFTGSLGLVDLLPFDEYVRSLHRKRMSAGVLLRDSEDRLLMVEPSYKPQWEIPGGVVEENESPWTAAVREAHEEVGFDRPLGRLLVIDHVLSDGAMPEGIAFVFDGGLITEREVRELVLTDPEIVSVSLHTLEEAAAKVKPSFAERLAAALTAARTGDLAFCENGKRVAG